MLPFFDPIREDHAEFQGTIQPLEAIEIDAIL
jgi:hypothetical protein